MTTPHLDELTAAPSAHNHNHLLFSILSDNTQRSQLYQELLAQPQVLSFTSRADTKFRATDDGNSEYHQTVHLLTQRTHIQQALTDTTKFSNAPYLALGSGTFMLGLDKDQPTPATDEHLAQRKLAMRAFQFGAPTIAVLSGVAYLAASTLPLKSRHFDLALLAEQAALRFVGFLFGFAQSDIALLERTTRLAYAGMGYQMYARHFVTSPGTLLDASTGMGGLLIRVAQLIDQYQNPIGRVDTDEAKTIADELAELQAFHPVLTSFKPVLQGLAENPGSFSGTELAAIVVGAIAGIVGNVQASVSIAISQFFELKLLDDAQKAPDSARLQNMVMEALRLQPPAPFLPRKALCDNPFADPLGAQIKAGDIVILAIGAATRQGDNGPLHRFRPGTTGDDPLIFGGPTGATGAATDYLHQCLGKHIALPLITHVVQQVLALPGLDRVLDERTGDPQPLVKRWGFNCDSFPLQYTVDKALIQQSLNVVMPIKTPLSLHAEMVKKIIAYGAPRIQRRLDQSRHVHFAWFNLQNNDSELALHTVFDGDFDAYIEHFAVQIGPLFDQLLEHIQHASPRPVAEFPKEFVDTIRRFHQAPVGGYFYSAHPLRTVDKTIPPPRSIP
nr:cytochrome P450 [uncultured Albidiferax sp.]